MNETHVQDAPNRDDTHGAITEPADGGAVIAAAAEISPEIRRIPLNRLEPWSDNPRSRMSEEGIESLKASIRAGGVMQNCVAMTDDDGTYRVIAGERRLTALKQLAGDGEIPADTPINCTVRTDGDRGRALLDALSENEVRENMDPIDVCVSVAELAGRYRVGDLAAAFGLTKRTVREHVQLGNLVPEAQELIRNRERTLEWGKALAAADQPTQARVCADVAANDTAWTEPDQIRRFLTQEAIPAENALFDLSRYRGRIIRDMFDGDFLADRDEFWRLQDEEIEQIKAQLESEGYAEVRVQNRPLDQWRFRTSDDPSVSIAVVEKLPHGKVNVHRGLVDDSAHDPDAAHQPAEDDGGDPAAGEDEHALPGSAVRTTPGILDYAAAHRSAIVQSRVAGDFRLALEVATAALLGHSGTSTRSRDYTHPGGHDIRTGPAFDAVADARGEVDSHLHGLGAGPDRDRALLAMIRELDDASLRALFTRATALKVGQQQPRDLDRDPGDMLNVLARDVDVRANWTPDENFFALMQSEDLRRIASEVLPRNQQAGLATARKPHLVRILSDAFAAAASNDGTLDAATARRLNEWLPGPMAFPAHDDAEAAAAGGEDAGDAEDEDAFGALFGESGEEAPEDDSTAYANI